MTTVSANTSHDHVPAVKNTNFFDAGHQEVAELSPEVVKDEDKNTKLSAAQKKPRIVIVPFQMPHGKWEMVKFDIAMCRECITETFDVVVLPNSSLVTRSDCKPRVYHANSECRLVFVMPFLLPEALSESHFVVL